MTRGTTPVIRIRAKGDITQFQCKVTLKQGTDYLETFEMDRIEMTYDEEIRKTVIVISMTQEETLALEAQKYCELQLRGINASGVAIASKIYNTTVDRILLDGVITYDDGVAVDEM